MRGFHFSRCVSQVHVGLPAASKDVHTGASLPFRIKCCSTHSPAEPSPSGFKRKRDAKPDRLDLNKKRLFSETLLEKAYKKR